MFTTNTYKSIHSLFYGTHFRDFTNYENNDKRKHKHKRNNNNNNKTPIQN